MGESAIWRSRSGLESETETRGHFHGTIACLSALFHAGRQEEFIALLDKAPVSLWHYREWGVRALAAMGRKAEAIRYAEASRALNDKSLSRQAFPRASMASRKSLEPRAIQGKRAAITPCHNATDVISVLR